MVNSLLCNTDPDRMVNSLPHHMKRMRLNDTSNPPEKPALQAHQCCLSCATWMANPPTWGQLKRRTQKAEEMLMQQQVTKSPQTLFVAMLAIISCQVVLGNTDNYWAYGPDPPLLRPVE